MQHITGKRLLLTRAADDNRPWIERLHSLGAEPIPFPCIHIEELALSIDWEAQLADSQWVVFTSQRAVLRFADLLSSHTLAAHQIAAVGTITQAACLDRFGRCDLRSKSGTAASLAATLTPKLVPDAGVLIPGAADPRPELPEALLAAGARPIPLAIYATPPAVANGAPTDFTNAGLDAVLFASPSAVQGASATTTLPPDLPAACIGPTTTAAAQAAGFAPTTTAPTRDLDGLLRSLAGLLSTNPTSPKTR